MCIYLNLMILIKIIRGFIRAECKKTGSDSQNCRNVKEANFRYQQLHAKEPNFKEYFKKYKDASNHEEKGDVPKK